METWRVLLGQEDHWSEAMTAEAVVERLLACPEALWIESDGGSGSFAQDVPEVRELLLQEHSRTVARLYLEREGAAALWVWELVDDLCTQDGRGAVRMIRALVEEAKSDKELESIGAGPLEDVLRRQGPVAIGPVEEAAAGDPRFRYALAGVWPSEENPEIWKRWRAALGDQ